MGRRADQNVVERGARRIFRDLAKSGASPGIDLGEDFLRSGNELIDNLISRRGGANELTWRRQTRVCQEKSIQHLRPLAAHGEPKSMPRDVRRKICTSQ